MTISEGIRLVRVRSVSTLDERSTRTSTDGDQPDVVARCHRWRRAFREDTVAYPATVLAIPLAAKWVRDKRCEVDARSPQGVAFAMSARLSPGRVLFHCNGTAGRTLTDALGLGIGQFIVDSESAAVKLGSCAERPQHVVVDVSGGEADGLVAAVLAEEQLTMTGFYAEADDLHTAVSAMFEHAADARSRHGVLLSRIGIAVHIGWSNSPEWLAEEISFAVEDGCARFRLPRPAVTVFPDWNALTRDA